MDEVFINNDELRFLFNKYSIFELGSISFILEYVHNYNVENVKIILDEVYQKKIEQFDDDYIYNINTKDLKNKNKTLNMKELLFFKLIVDDSLRGLELLDKKDETTKKELLVFSESLSRSINKTNKSERIEKLVYKISY